MTDMTHPMATHPTAPIPTTSGADVVLATVRAGATHGQGPGGAAQPAEGGGTMQPAEGGGATAVTLDRPGSRLRPGVWQGLLSGVLAAGVTAVSIPLLATLYDVFVPLAFLVAAIHAAALVLAPFRPRLAIGLSVGSVLAIAALSLGASRLPDLAWPLPVATLITALLVLALIGLRGDARTTVTALVAHIVAASAPLVVTLADGDLWSAAVPNLLTFHCVAVLVTALALGASRAISRVTVAR